jgi:hypothetical protein
MFKKEKQQSLYNSVDDSRSIVHDFLLRSTLTGFESYRTTEYTFYHKLDESEMIPRIDDHLEKMFAGSVDDANGDMLDEIIFGAAREAFPYLSKQHIDHNDTIRRLIVRRTADRDDICRIRDERVIERDKMQADYDKICKALEKAEEA